MNTEAEFVKGKIEEGYIVIKIDRHAAKNTEARTIWLKPDDMYFVYDNSNPRKTHWYEYYLTRPETKWLRVRRTNRGNWHTTEYFARDLKISDQELQELLALLSET
jgi:hypothetical protein